MNAFCKFKLNYSKTKDDIFVFENNLILSKDNIQSQAGLKDTNQSIFSEEFASKIRSYLFVDFYTAFDQYLEELLVEYLLNNEPIILILKNSKKHLHEDFLSADGDIVQFVKKIKGKNNKGVMTIVRILTYHLNSCYSNDIKDQVFLSIATHLRHAIIHNQGYATDPINRMCKNNEIREAIRPCFDFSTSNSNKLLISKTQLEYMTSTTYLLAESLFSFFATTT